MSPNTRGLAPRARPEAGLGWVRRGSPPPAVGVGGVTPGKFLKTQMLNPAFWWLLHLLVGSRGRVYQSKSTSMSRANSVAGCILTKMFAEFRVIDVE